MNANLKSNILYVTHYTQMYGANKSLINLIEGLKEHRAIVIVPSEGEITAILRERDITYFVQKFHMECYPIGASLPILKGVLKWILNLLYAIRLSFKLRKYNILLIHSNSSVMLAGAYLAKLLGIPHVWHIREFIYEHYQYKYSFGLAYFEYWLRKAAFVVCISNSIKKIRASTIPDNKVKVIPNGVMFAKDVVPSKPTEKKCICYGVVGVISPAKNQKEAITAFNLLNSKYDNIKLYIIGDGLENHVQNLKDEVKRLDIEDKVIFTGYQHDMNKYYHKLDVLLMTSRNEALGRVTLEAMANGVAVIGFDQAGTSEIIVQNKNGFLYKGNAEDLAKQMEKLLLDTDKRAEFIKTAQEMFLESYTIEIYSQRVEQLYQTVAIGNK